MVPGRHPLPHQGGWTQAAEEDHRTTENEHHMQHTVGKPPTAGAEIEKVEFTTINHGVVSAGSRLALCGQHQLDPWKDTPRHI